MYHFILTFIHIKERRASNLTEICYGVRYFYSMKHL